MNQFTRLAPISGFDDRIGESVRIQRWIESRMRDLFEQNGFQEYIPPMLEKAEIYGEGVSIDPESWLDGGDATLRTWNETVNREFLPIVVSDFRGNQNVGKEICILRPEGTASLCRYIARGMTEWTHSFMGELKVYYVIPCFRNESTDNINSVRRREFNQIGLEYVGRSGTEADIEAFRLGYEGLRNIGQSDVYVRISDVNIFRKLCDLSGFDTGTRVRIKECIDDLSKARVLETDYEKKKMNVEREIASLSADANIRRSWSAVCSVTGDESSIEELEKDTDVELYKLKEFFSGLKASGVPVSFDPAMIRSWVYYTGPICQYDARTSKGIYAEIGGGGRYDALVGNFLRKYGIGRDMPATGFAFGTERLVEITPGETNESNKFDMERC